MNEIWGPENPSIVWHWLIAVYLFLAGFLTAMFLFTGVGMLNIFSSSHGEEQALLGAGLVEIMRDFLIVMVLIALFLVTLVLSFYRQRRAESTGLLETLGIRSDARFAAWIREIVLCFAAAGIAGISRGMLIRLFRSHFGKTPGRFLMEIRLNQIRHLLDSTELTLSEIARRCGYGSDMALSLAFRRENGIPPGEFRNSRRHMEP